MSRTNRRFADDSLRYWEQVVIELFKPGMEVDCQSCWTTNGANGFGLEPHPPHGRQTTGRGGSGPSARRRGRSGCGLADPAMQAAMFCQNNTGYTETRCIVEMGMFAGERNVPRSTNSREWERRGVVIVSLPLSAGISAPGALPTWCERSVFLPLSVDRTPRTRACGASHSSCAAHSSHKKLRPRSTNRVTTMRCGRGGDGCG